MQFDHVTLGTGLVFGTPSTLFETAQVEMLHLAEASRLLVLEAVSAASLRNRGLLKAAVVASDDAIDALRMRAP